MVGGQSKCVLMGVGGRRWVLGGRAQGCPKRAAEAFRLIPILRKYIIKHNNFKFTSLLSFHVIFLSSCFNLWTL